MTWFTVSRLQDLLSMALVGALWGCTNPLLRKGSVEAQEENSEKSDSFLISSLRTFLYIQVWLPYVLNQLGSVVFYVLLANSDLSLAVPTCNALALLFSFLTSSLLGEPIEKPFQTMLGASMIVVGVTMCVSAQEEGREAVLLEEAEL